MYSHLHFENDSLLRIRDLSGPYRHSCTPQQRLCWYREGENVCLPQTELSTSQAFSLRNFQVYKWIYFLLLPVEFTSLCCALCEVWTECGVDKVLYVEYHCDAFLIAFLFPIIASDGSVLRKLFLNDYSPLATLVWGLWVCLLPLLVQMHNKSSTQTFA